MHVYFFSSLAPKGPYRQTVNAILEVLQQTDLWVSSNTTEKEVQASAEVLAAAKASDTPLMDQMDAFIIEGTDSVPDVGFLLAQALATKKPTLYLFRRGTVPEIFTHFQRTTVPKFVTIAAYQQEQVQATVLDFLQSISGQNVKEVPRLKFTLRLTTTQDDYLDFKTRNTKTTKADFLRDHLDRIITDDPAWLAWKKKRRDQEKK